MPVLIEPNTGIAKDIPQGELQSVIGQGWRVPLLDKDGNPQAVPYEDASRLLSSGFSRLNNSQYEDLLNQAKYGTAGQKALAFTEGAIKGIAGPAYSFFAPLTGLTTKEEIRNREEYQPELETTGEIGSTIVGAVTGTGLPGLIGKVGKGAAVAGKLFGKAGQLAAQGAAEAALYSASNEINEKVLGNPEAVSESILSHMGLSAMLGAGAGLAMVPAAGLLSKSGKLTQNVAQKLIDKDVGHLAEKVYDKLTDAFLPGIAKPATNLAKKALVKSVLTIAPEKGAILNQIEHLSNMAEKTSSLIETKAGGIFGTQIEKDSGPSNYEHPNGIKMDPLGIMVMDHANNPEKLIDKMNNATMTMAQNAPDISMALSAQTAKAVSFLASKLPALQKEGLLDSEPKVPAQDIQKFNRYAQVVENPISVLNFVKRGTVLPQDLEALGSVYPALYQTMKTTVMDKLIDKMGKQKSLLLPYNKRMSLSLFLGMPLDSTMKAQNIMANQAAFGTMHLEQVQKSARQQIGRSHMNRMDPLRDLTRAQKALTR